MQYASDLHIDGWPPGTSFTTFLTPCSPVLIIAGDICSAWNPLYFQFLAWAAKHWRTVIVIAGNHEYHNTHKHTIAETDAHIHDFCSRKKNVFYLQGGASYLIPGTSTRIIGTTLWCAPDPVMWTAAAKKKGDYRFIYIDDPTSPKGKRKLHPSDVYTLHIVHKALLQFAIHISDPSEKLTVVTHYMPSKMLLEPEYRDEELHTFYASNDEDLFTSQCKLWICGHGHRATKHKVPDGPLLVMNARGYNKPSEQGRAIDMYDPCAVLKMI